MDDQCDADLTVRVYTFKRTSEESSAPRMSSLMTMSIVNLSSQVTSASIESR